MTTSAQLGRLREGNQRFVNGTFANESNRAALEKGQAPFAAVLTCADSRVAPELLFDEGRGQLFVVRVAGNVANASSIASLEYAVAHLGVRLIVVMGHQSCGAVGAAIGGNTESPSLVHLLAHIGPAVKALPDAPVDDVARRNAVLMAERLTDISDILRDAATNDGLEIVPAFFPWSGEVELGLG